MVLLKEIPPTIPKGPIRERLKRTGRIRTLNFNRIMSENEVKWSILNGFSDTNIENFHFLQSTKDNRLLKSEHQSVDGNAVIKLAGSGSLYIQQQPKTHQPQLAKEVLASHSSHTPDPKVSKLYIKIHGPKVHLGKSS